MNRLTTAMALAILTPSAFGQHPPKPTPEEIRAAELLAEKILVLRERLYVVREARRADKVLETASALIKLDPLDPWPYFIRGEAHASFGKKFSAKKATEALKRFLKLAGPNPTEVVTGRHVVNREDRLEAHRLLLRMEDGKPVMLLTASSVLRDRIRAVQVGIAQNEKAKQFSRDSIRNAEAYISNISRSRHERKASHIASKRRIIAKHEKRLAKAEDYIAEQREEIRLLEQELSQRPKPSPVKLGTAGRRR